MSLSAQALSANAYLVRVHALARLLPVDVLNDFTDDRHAGHAADQQHFVDLLLLQGRVLQAVHAGGLRKGWKKIIVSDYSLDNMVTVDVGSHEPGEMTRGMAKEIASSADQLGQS